MKAAIISLLIVILLLAGCASKTAPTDNTPTGDQMAGDDMPAEEPMTIPLPPPPPGLPGEEIENNK